VRFVTNIRAIVAVVALSYYSDCLASVGGGVGKGAGVGVGGGKRQLLISFWPFCYIFLGLLCSLRRVRSQQQQQRDEIKETK